MPLPILYKDESLVVINKPSGLLVHRSVIDKYETRFAVQLLRNQLGQKVYPVHRLDKPTSGVLLFALNPEAAHLISRQWPSVEKRYFALTRGKVSDCEINHPVKTEDKAGHEKVQTATTIITCLNTFCLPVVFGKQAGRYTETSFSLIEAQPKTGRKHQIRKHLKHISHPIVGDTRYGRGEINRYFRKHYHVNRLMLHCHTLRFCHPLKKKTVNVYAPLDATWLRLLSHVEWRL